MAELSVSELSEVGTDSLKVSRFLAAQDPLALLAQELGVKFRLYRDEWERARTFQSLPPFPLHVDYEIQLKCDLRCPICPNGLAQKGHKGQKEPLALKKDAVIALLKEGTAQGQRSMGFGGLWEPLTYAELPEIVAVGRELGIVDAMLNTNGQLLDRAKSLELVKAGLTRLMVSVDAATAKTYAIARPGGDFGLLESNILGFLAAREELGRKLPILRLSFCVTRLNEGELGRFLAKWEKKVDFFSVQSYGRFDPKAPALFPKNGPFPAPGGRCAQPQKRLLVRHDGTTTPCCDLSGLSLTLGDVKTESLTEIWAGARIQKIRAALAGPKASWPKACQACQAKYG